MIVGLIVSSVAGSFITDYITTKKLNEKIVESGYKITEKIKTFREKRNYVLSRLIPGYNLFKSIGRVITLKNEAKFQKYLQKKVANGEITRVEPPTLDEALEGAIIDAREERTLSGGRRVIRNIKNTVSKPFVKIRSRFRR